MYIVIMKRCVGVYLVKWCVFREEVCGCHVYLVKECVNLYIVKRCVFIEEICVYMYVYLLHSPMCYVSHAVRQMRSLFILVLAFPLHPFDCAYMD